MPRIIGAEEAAKLRAEEEANDVVSTLRLFLNLVPPKGKQPTPYTVKFLQEPKEMVATNGWQHIYVHVQLMHDVGAYKAGMYTLDLVKVMLQERVLPFRPLTGKTLTIANLGKRFGRKYFDYDVKLV